MSENKKIIAVASDHAGFDLKEIVIKHLENRCYEVIDEGPFNTESVDYPDFAKKLTTDIQEGKAEFGIAICGTGIGINIACNKAKGIRAALCSDPLSARLTRMHNNANVLNMGARIIGVELAIDIVDNFLDAEFEGGRHQKRIDKLEL